MAKKKNWDDPDGLLQNQFLVIEQTMKLPKGVKKSVQRIIDKLNKNERHAKNKIAKRTSS